MGSRSGIYPPMSTPDSTWMHSGCMRPPQKKRKMKESLWEFPPLPARFINQRFVYASWGPIARSQTQTLPPHGFWLKYSLAGESTGSDLLVSRVCPKECSPLMFGSLGQLRATSAREKPFCPIHTDRWHGSLPMILTHRCCKANPTFGDICGITKLLTLCVS